METAPNPSGRSSVRGSSYWARRARERLRRCSAGPEPQFAVESAAADGVDHDRKQPDYSGSLFSSASHTRTRKATFGRL